jgi:hypothetical protein
VACAGHGVRLKRLIKDRGVAVENTVPKLLLVGGQLAFWLAQEREQLVDPLRIVVLSKSEKPPEALRRVGGPIVRRRIEDVMEPTLCLGKTLRLAQVHGNCDRDVKEQLPVVVRVRAVV